MEAELINLSLGALLFLMAAAFFAGFIDSMAGGGGLISIPAALLAGLPPQLSLGTNKFMSSFGTVISFITYSRNNAVIWRIAGIGLAFSLAGSVAGSKTALYCSDEILGKILIFLLPLAALLTFAPIRRFQRDIAPSRTALYLLTPLICTLVGFYDGFFGPGTGSFLILALHLALGMNLIKAAGTAKAFNLASNVSSLVVFLLSGKVFFMAAIPMAAANIAGNALGARLAIKRGPALIRKALLFSLALLFVTLVWKYYKA